MFFNPLTAIINYSTMMSPQRVLIFNFQVSCHGFMGRLKAFLPRLTSGSAGIVDLNPSKEYVKPFGQVINVTHDE